MEFVFVKFSICLQGGGADFFVWSSGRGDQILKGDHQIPGVQTVQVSVDQR